MHNYRLNSSSKYNNNTTKNIDSIQNKDQLQQDNKHKRCNVQRKVDKNQKHITISMSSQQYTSLHIRHLGNHSLWKKTTFQNRYNDNRLQFINPNQFVNKYVLEIGCNEGFLAMEIAMRFFPKQIYAIDIDNRLIKNAKRTLYNIIKRDVNYQKLVNQGEKQEQQQRLHQVEKAQQQYMPGDDVKFAQLDIHSHHHSEHYYNNEEKHKQQKQVVVCKDIQQLPLFFQDRLKSAFTLDYYLPDNVKLSTQQQMFKPENKFPMNIKFAAQNIYTIKYQQDKLYYDTIVCLKVTKWIHLTFGDDGIRRLFQKIYDLLRYVYQDQLYRLDGVLILQAQDWASYKRKKNMYPLYRENYDRICYGPNEFQSILVNDPLRDFKFELVRKIDQNQRSDKSDRKLDYPILIFRKKSTMLYY